jgi:hypothetical protein
MPATFSWVQYTGSNAASTTPNGSGVTATSSNNSMSWDFEVADSTGTTTYTANPVSAGSASYPVWIKGQWTNSVAYTISNLKFWQFNPAASSANTASFTIFGQTQNSYSIATGTATGTNWASSVAVPTAAQSTASPGAPITGLGSYATSGAGQGVNGTGASGTNTPGGWLALQLSAGAAAPAGTTGYFGFTLQYDEQ